MKTTHVLLGASIGTFSSVQQNADCIHKWSQTATSSSSDAIKVQESVQFAIDHLRKPVSSLHFLDLAGRGLTSLPPLSILQQLQGITILHLNQNNLPGKELEKLRALDSLRYLNVSDNPLTEIPTGVLANHQALQSLEADGCGLHHFPDDILKLSRLGTLSLQDNPLSELPARFGYAMISLAELSIQGTEITQLPASLVYLGRLKVNQ